MKQIAIVFLSLLLAACSAGPQGRERTSFNNDWLFSLTDNQADLSAPDADDTGWRQLNLPHDWSIEADFSKENSATPGGRSLARRYGLVQEAFQDTGK